MSDTVLDDSSFQNLIGSIEKPHSPLMNRKQNEEPVLETKEDEANHGNRIDFLQQVVKTIEKSVKKKPYEELGKLNLNGMNRH